MAKRDCLITYYHIIVSPLSSEYVLPCFSSLGQLMDHPKSWFDKYYLFDIVIMNRSGGSRTRTSPLQRTTCFPEFFFGKSYFTYDRQYHNTESKIQKALFLSLQASVSGLTLARRSVYSQVKRITKYLGCRGSKNSNLQSMKRRLDTI